MSNMKALNDLLEVIKNGDEDGNKPDLTEKEVEAVEWAKKRIAELEKVNQKLGQNWIKTLIAHFELMDEANPEWRVHLKDEITQLTNTIKEQVKR